MSNLKGAFHPAGFFHIGSLGITPVVPYNPCAYLLLFLYVASCSLFPHDRESQSDRLAAKVEIYVSICVHRRIKLSQVYPQKLWIISDL